MKVTAYMEKILEGASCLLLALMSIIVFFNVVARYVFAKAFPWTEEISLFMFTWIIFIGALLAFKRHRHLGIDILINLLPVLGKKVAALLSNLLVGGCLLVLLEGGVKYYFQTVIWPAPATQIPYGYINAIIPFSAFFMMLLLIQDTIRIFIKSEVKEDKG